MIGGELHPTRRAIDGAYRQRLVTVAGVVELAKVRILDADYLRALDAVLGPTTRYIARPPSEGRTLAEIIDGYLAVVKAFAEAGLLDRLGGYEIGNEPNYWHPERPGPFADADGPRRYGELLAAFFAIIRPGIPIISPALQPHRLIVEWVAVLEQFAEHWAYRGLHCYWEFDDVGDAIAAASAQGGTAPPEHWIVTEFGDSGTSPQEVRIERCRDAARRFAELGIAGAVLFILDADAEWQDFVFPPEDVRSILLAGRLAPVVIPPTPAGPVFRLGFAEYVRQHTEIAAPLEDERPDWEGNAYQRYRDRAGGQGILRWDKARNRVGDYALIRET